MFTNFNKKTFLQLDLGGNIESRLTQLLSEIQNTVYQLGAKQEQAPSVTDCVTAVRYLVGGITGEYFPLTYIGSMPNDLLVSGFLGAKPVPIHQHKIGNLVFFYGKSRFKVDMIRHVGMIINEGMYFHSLWKRNVGGGTITGLSQRYSYITTYQQLIGSRDPREKEQN